MKLIFGGGAAEVGASFLLLQIDGKNIALDCGIRMTGSNIMPDFSFLSEIGSVDAILLSHAHMDHSGSLPVLAREYPNAKLYMTHITKDLIRVLLLDTLKIMEYKEYEIPIFAEVHVESMLNNIICHSPTHTFRPFADRGIEVCFHSAGHIAGAAGIYITGEEGSFFYSGDFSVAQQMTVEGAAFPRLRPDAAVFESTYGNRLHASRDVEESRLLQTISDVIAQKGKLLIPAFSLGRAQELLLIINRAVSKKILPGNIKVYVDGMVNDICRVYENNPNYLRTRFSKKLLRGKSIFYNDNIIAVNRNNELRREIVNCGDGLVIISSSGMLNGGPSQWYAEKLAGNESNYIALTGYQDEESPGRQLLEMLNLECAERVLKIGERSIPIKCGLGMYGLSAHADKMEIISLAQTLGATTVFLNHGDEEIVYSLGAELQKEYRGRVYIPRNGESFTIEIRNKRKQASRTEPNINKLMPDRNENIYELWRFVLENYGTSRAFTIEDLYLISYGCECKCEQEFIQFREDLNKSECFVAEKKRPFMFRALEQTDLVNGAGPMEVNKALALASEYFPAETGLYKKGARVLENVILLSFNFPITAVQKLSDRIEQFEHETGWKVEINSECNLNAAERLIISLLPAGTRITKKISFYRTENAFRLSLNNIPANAAELENRFLEQTGINLFLSDKSGTNAAPTKKAAKLPGQTEQNKTFRLIEKVFEGKPHKLYKKSLKSKNGMNGIELSFITPAVGELYRNEIDELEATTYWNIWLNQEPNQHELLRIADELLTASNITYKKLSCHVDKQIVAVSFNIDRPTPAAALALSNKFHTLTGFELMI